MENIFEQLNNYSGAIAVLLTAITGFWALLKLREYLKDKRFTTYHQLIDDLVNETKNPEKIIKLDRQIAIIFELRNYSSYYPVTKRILMDLKELWAEQPRAIKEIDFTLDFISKNCVIRTYRKLLKK